MNDEAQNKQRRESEGRINEKLESSKYAQGITDQRLTALERGMSKLREAIRKLTAGS